MLFCGREPVLARFLFLTEKGTFVTKTHHLLTAASRRVIFGIVLSLTAAIGFAQTPVEYPIPTSGAGPSGIALGPDGNMWFTETNASRIGKITPAGVITDYATPTAASNPTGIVAGPDGNLWFTEPGVNKIGKLVASSATMTEFLIPTANSGPQAITSGPDGNLWFTESNASKIGKITTGGTVTEYPVTTGLSLPYDITTGPDGNLWFTEQSANKIGFITTSGVVTEFSTQSSGGSPQGIVAGPDGNLWFAESGADMIGQISTGGSVNSFHIPTAASHPNQIIKGSDGNLWFTETSGNNIAKITTAGLVTEYALPTANSGPTGIASPANGTIWFTENTAGKIGALVASGQAFAHMAVGPLGSDVWTTAIILNNTTSTAANFTLNFFEDTGQPWLIGTSVFNETHQPNIVVTQSGQTLSGPIPANGNLTLVLSASAFAEGWATLADPSISGQVVFHRHTSTGADYEATVPLAAGGTQYMVPFDSTTYYNGSSAVASLPYITGMALANLDPTSTATISCAILDQDGLSLGTATPITLPPMGHTAVQLNAGSGFGNVPGNIGSLNCSSNGPLFSVLGLRFLGANDLTSFAAIKLH